MEEIRIDCAHQTAEEIARSVEETQTLFRFNHTMPFTEEHTEQFYKLFPGIGENSRVGIPLKGVRFHNVHIGDNVVVMDGCLMMSAGGITIEDEALIAPDVQLISNNHDLHERAIITCKPVRFAIFLAYVFKHWIGKEIYLSGAQATSKQTTNRSLRNRKQQNQQSFPA